MIISWGFLHQLGVLLFGLVITVPLWFLNLLTGSVCWWGDGGTCLFCLARSSFYIIVSAQVVS